MADTQMTPFVPRELRLEPKESYLVGLQYKNVRRQYPNAGKNGYKSDNNTIEFTWSEADGVSLMNTVLQFKASYFTNATQNTEDPSACVNSAMDFIDRVEFFVGSTSVLNTTTSRARMLSHILMKNELGKEWFEYAGKNLVGWNSRELNRVGDAPTGANGGVPTHARGGRTFQVPLWCIHPAFMNMQNVPVLGENLTVRLTLAQNSALSSRSGATSTYRLDNCELHVEQILYEPDYKQALMGQIAGSEGFKMQMIDYDIMQHQNTGSVDLAFTQRNQRNNALSMYIWNAGIAREASDLSYSDPNLTIDIGTKVENLKVYSGNRSFLPVNGISEPVELLGHLEKCSGGYAHEDTGIITWDEYTGVGGRPYAPIAVSLERTDIADTDTSVSNRGLSAMDYASSAEIQVQCKLSGALGAGEELYSALVYEKALVMRDGEISIQE